MNIQEQEKQLTEFTQKMSDTLLKKGNDYANSDRLSNFKTSSAIVGITPEIDCLVIMATKVARLGVLLNSNKQPNNESIQDSIIDLANYTFLLSCLLNEKKSCNTETSCFYELNRNRIEKCKKHFEDLEKKQKM